MVGNLQKRMRAIDHWLARCDQVVGTTAGFRMMLARARTVEPDQVDAAALIDAREQAYAAVETIADELNSRDCEDFIQIVIGRDPYLFQLRRFIEAGSVPTDLLQHEINQVRRVDPATADELQQLLDSNSNEAEAEADQPDPMTELLPLTDQAWLERGGWRRVNELDQDAADRLRWMMAETHCYPAQDLNADPDLTVLERRYRLALHRMIDELDRTETFAVFHVVKVLAHTERPPWVFFSTPERAAYFREASFGGQR